MKKNLSHYLDEIKKNNISIGDNSHLQVILEKEAITKWEKENNLEIGILLQDKFITLIRDLVQFPSGRLGGYNRIINTSTLEKGGAGAVVFPVMDGKILLIKIFRHPTRQWSLEVPRGFGEPGVSALELAEKEVNEEIEGKIKRVEDLGILHNNTGLEGNDVQLYYAELGEVGKPRREEGIDQILWVSTKELEGLIAKGKITDGFTIAAYTRAKLKGLLNG